MNLTINSQSLAAELRLLSKVAPTKPSIAILGSALLTADGDVLRCFATDLEIGITTTCPASVMEPGTIVLPVAKFLSLVEQFPNDDVTLRLDKQHVLISCGAFASKMPTLSSEDFPVLPTITGETCAIEGAVLSALIAKTRYAISPTSQKYVLQGALLTMTGPVAAMAATDGKRLALATASRDAGADLRVILPTKTLDVLSEGIGSTIEMTVGEQHLFFAYGDRTLTSRMLEGKFPKYEAIIPRDNDKIVTIDRVAMAAALRRATLVSEENQAVYLTPSSGALDLSASSLGMGAAVERVPAAYDGGPLKICVNGAYLLDVLNAAQQPMVTMAFKDAKSALLLTDGDDHLGVIMLMRW